MKAVHFSKEKYLCTYLSHILSVINISGVPIHFTDYMKIKQNVFKLFLAHLLII